MPEYIEREAVLKLQYWEGCGHIRYGVVDVADIENIPAADVAPVVHGRWIRRGNEKKCSVCGFIYYSNNDEWNGCPNCLAKMDGR